MEHQTGKFALNRDHKSFACRLLFILLFSASLLWVVGPVMRESDQASLLDGALRIARDGQLSGLTFYNYDRTYVSYWMLASVFKIFGLERGDADAVVLAGNMLACAVFLIGFAVAWLRSGPSEWCGWVVVLTGLLCPTLLFSMPLLSSNMISAGWLFLLIVMMSRRGHLAGDLVAGLLAYLAVGARADAVLVMPLLAVLSSRESTWGSLFSDRRIWMAGIGSLLALATGMALSSIPPYNPPAIFEPTTFAAYFVFGMGGALVLLFGLIGWKSAQLIRKPSLYACLIVLSLALPLLYYSWLMYTPRHLVTAVFVLLCTAMFDRGRRWWIEMIDSLYGRGVVIAGAGLCVVLMFVGVSMDSMKKGSLLLGAATYYPTSDGHWPMGANLDFLSRLKNASNAPIDHNQRVWGAWKNIDKEEIADMPSVVRSCGLESYGMLSQTLVGWGSAKDNSDGGAFLMDGRSLFKEAAGSKLVGGDDPIHWRGKRGEVVGRCAGDIIFLVTDRAADDDEEWELWRRVSQVSDGNDYLMVAAENRQAALPASGRYKWMVIFPNGEEDLGKALISNLTRVGVSSASLGHTAEVVIVSFEAAGEPLDAIFSKLPVGAWIARSSLPAFMQRKIHRGRQDP